MNTAKDTGCSATNQPANAIRNHVFDPLFNKDTAFDTSTSLETLNRAELPRFLYPVSLRPAGVKFQGFGDYAAFDWRNRSKLSSTALAASAIAGEQTGVPRE